MMPTPPIRRRSRHCLVAVVVAVLLALAAPLAAACSCPMLTVPQAVAQADLVARVTVDAVDRPRVSKSSADLVTYTLRPSVVWKGDVAGLVMVGSAFDSASCGIASYEVGEEIIIFASRDGDRWRASLCGGTAPATPDLVEKVTAAAGPGTAVTVAPAPPSEHQTWVLPAVSIAAAGLLALGAWLWWRRSRSVSDDV